MPRRVPLFLDPATEGACSGGSGAAENRTGRSRNGSKRLRVKSAKRNGAERQAEAVGEPGNSGNVSGLQIELNHPPATLTHVGTENHFFIGSLLAPPSQGMYQDVSLVTEKTAAFVEGEKAGSEIDGSEQNLDDEIHVVRPGGENCWGPSNGTSLSPPIEECSNFEVREIGNLANLGSRSADELGQKLDPGHEFDNSGEPRVQEPGLSGVPILVNGHSLGGDGDREQAFQNQVEGTVAGSERGGGPGHSNISQEDGGVEYGVGGEGRSGELVSDGEGVHRQCRDSSQISKPARMKDLIRAKSSTVLSRGIILRKENLGGEDDTVCDMEKIKVAGKKRKRGTGEPERPLSTAAHSRVPAKALSAEDRLERIRNLASELKKSQKVAGRLRTAKQALQQQYENVKDLLAEKHILEKYKAVSKLCSNNDLPDILSLLADSMLSGSLPLGSIRFHRLVSLAVNCNKVYTNQLQYSEAEMRYFSRLKRQSCAAAVLEAMRGPMNVGEGHGKHLLRTAKITEFVPSLKAIDRFEKQILMRKEAQPGEPPPLTAASDNGNPETAEQPITYVGPAGNFYCVDEAGLELVQLEKEAQVMDRANHGPEVTSHGAPKAKVVKKSKRSRKGKTSIQAKANGTMSRAKATSTKKQQTELHAQQTGELLQVQQMEYDGPSYVEEQLPETDRSEQQRGQLQRAHVAHVMQEDFRGQQMRTQEYGSPSVWQDARVQFGLGMGGPMMAEKERSLILCQPMPQVDMVRDYDVSGEGQEHTGMYRHQTGLPSHRGEQASFLQFEQPHGGADGSPIPVGSIRPLPRTFHHSLDSEGQERDGASYLHLHSAMPPLQTYDVMEHDLGGPREANMVLFMRAQPSPQSHAPMQPMHPDFGSIRGEVSDAMDARPQLGFAPYATSEHSLGRFLATPRTCSARSIGP